MIKYFINQIKAAEDFYNRYDQKTVRVGFAGGGQNQYIDKTSGHIWEVDKTPNGKTFYGTDHNIKYVGQRPPKS